MATGAVNGSMTIPADIHTVRWYDGTEDTGSTTISAPTPWPGQPGVSLLAGHIDWAGQGPGPVLHRPARGRRPDRGHRLQPGDDLLACQPAAHHISKAALPADLFSNRGSPKLALVTCGGPYDPATRHYLDNVIVWATLVPADSSGNEATSTWGAVRLRGTPRGRVIFDA